MLGAIHTERKRRQKQKFPMTFEIFSLVYCASSLIFFAFVRCKRALQNSHLFSSCFTMYFCLSSGRPMAKAGLYSQAVVVMATLVTMVTSMALPGTKEDTDINLFMPGVQPQNVSTLCHRACVLVCVSVTASVVVCACSYACP